MKVKIFGCILAIALIANLQAQTIAEKKSGLGHVTSDLSEEMQKTLSKVNADLAAAQQELQHLYGLANDLYDQKAPESSYKDLLVKIKAVRQRIEDIENNWREQATHNQGEGYALWHQPSTTLEQLVIDYGAQDYVYLISPEVGAIPVSINSNVPIPRTSWGEMLETILSQNGVAVKQLNPYLRQLYLIKEDRSSLKIITNKRQDLQLLPDAELIAFMLSPEPSDVRRTWFFLEKFVNSKSTVLQLIGRDILIIGRISEIQELLKLYDFICANRGDKDYKAVTLSRTDPVEMSKILAAIFGGLTDEPSKGIEGPSKGGAGPKGPGSRGGTPTTKTNITDDNGLKVITLSHIAQAIFLIGTREEIRKAESIIHDVEDQVGEAQAKVIFWYTTKHSDPENLAEVLEKINSLMINEQPVSEGEAMNGAPPVGPPVPLGMMDPDGPVLRRPYDEGFFLDDRFVINKQRPRGQESFNNGRDNFIVDPKTGSIAMVVEASILPKLKELIKKLDVPKKMVQIEVLLFEKKLSNETNFGLNLLRIGTAALNQNTGSAVFNNIFPVGATAPHPENAGVFEFLFSRKKGSGIPAYDLAYRFLLSQEDVQINACPSILAINQTQAVIEITEEISVSTGIFQVETIAGVTLKDAFARAQYGIKIDVTPTIHMQNEDDPSGDNTDYVTLLTDISFQSFKPNDLTDRPDVTTRHIVNEVRIADGQTVILGGLRQKTAQDGTDAIPFLGELPGLGKLFSTNTMSDNSTEMFIFLTPKIVADPCEDLERIKLLEVARRPGDLPYFLCALDEAREYERELLIHGSMQMIFGRMPERCICPEGEYDGR